MREWKSSMSSNTTARPVCFSKCGLAAEGLMTAPSGARFPRRTAIPLSGTTGFESGRITSVS